MVEPADREFLRSIFLMEAWETVAALEDGADAAARGDAEALYVVTHRLKGAASLYGFPAVAELASRVEAALGSTPFDAGRLATLVSELKRALDAPTDSAPASAPAAAAAVEPVPPERPETTDGAASVLDDPVRRELAEFFAANADVASYFLPEATEHLDAMTTALLALERGAGEEDLARLFRSMHTIKGAAYVVGCVRVGELAHRAEDLLVAVREGDATLSPPALEALFVTVDVLKLMLGVSPNPAASITAVAADVRGRLEALLNAPSAASAVTEPPPAPAVPTTPVAPMTAALATPLPAPMPAAARRRPLPSSAAARRAPRQTIRVNLDRLDALMDLIGELVTGRNRVDRRLEDLDRLSASLFASRARLAEAVTEFERRQLDPRRAPPAAKVTSDKPAGLGGSGLSVAEMFAELEFDRYDDAGMFARSIAEIASDIAELQGELVGVNRMLRDDVAHVHRLTSAIRGEIGRARLVPIGNLFTRFVRQGKEAARAAGKQVRIETLGETVELDTSVIEQIVDPLLHLVQNAIGHGIESTDERRALGKPPIGAVTLSAAHQGGAVVLEVADDGRGIDPDLVRRRAVARGFVGAEMAATLSDREAIDLIFLPGFTTATSVTTASGRGVGMDVVRTNVRRLNGEIEVTSIIGEGTRFTLRLPLTVLVSEALLVRVAAETFAVALNAVHVVTALSPDRIKPGPRGESLTVGDDMVDLVSLAAVLGLPDSPRGARRPALVLRAAGRLLAVEVDEVLHKQDIVIKPLGAFLEGSGPYAGATVTADGRVVLLLDALGVAERVASRARAERASGAVGQADAPSVMSPVRKRVLLVDDSISVRRFVGQMLEKAGFDVITAADGADAITRLGEAAFDVVVTDLEMPRVNGYELIDDLRRRASTRTLPVIVLTTRAGDKHVALARQLGVDHYVTKPVEEQTFVALVGSLVHA
jgi:chemosensory pili system protein ChpA (sensor histidine kinase/response regulator)